MSPTTKLSNSIVYLRAAAKKGDFLNNFNAFQIVWQTFICKNPSKKNCHVQFYWHEPFFSRVPKLHLFHFKCGKL